jgi:integrase
MRAAGTAGVIGDLAQMDNSEHELGMLDFPPGRLLRATFGTRLGEASYNAFEIADLMGHSDIKTTRRYVRVMEGKKREAVKATMFQQGRVIEMPMEMRKEA